MVEWARDTPWRQGHVLPADATTALGVASPEQPNDTVAVVISHDCDIAQSPDVEPDVEIILGRRLPATDGNYEHAKNARRLHLSFSAGAERLIADLPATGKRLIRKSDLAAFEPLMSIELDRNEHATLQRWLAARYRRSAFPDEFDRRLDETGLRDRLGKILKIYGTSISAVFFDVDSGLDVARSGQNDIYVVGIYLLYSTEADPAAAEKAANAAATAIRKAFLEKCSGTDGVWLHIELVECEAIADRAMTVHQADHLRRWSADHISLRAGPAHPILREE
ncbi:MAG: hypothetical protein M0Z28_04745 [Rhodospirillales bacterium]|nr:hypothetical protein [Rhodospirillales bacterium]